VRYNPYTKNIEILNSKPQLEYLLKSINSEIVKITDALQKMR
jgi:Biopterin-dependent aromatic amino acid hydroxylase